MSKDSVKQMFGQMEKDAALKTGYAELMQAHLKDTEKLLAEKLIEFGKSSGFTFSNEDLLAARAELIEKTNSNKELSEDDLANVAGGGILKNLNILGSITTLGFSCAVCSIIFESTKGPGGCGANMSTTAKC